MDEGENGHILILNRSISTWEVLIPKARDAPIHNTNQMFITPDRINQVESCSNPEKRSVRGQVLLLRHQNLGPDRLGDPGQVEYILCASVSRL